MVNYPIVFHLPPEKMFWVGFFCGVQSYRKPLTQCLEAKGKTKQITKLVGVVSTQSEKYELNLSKPTPNRDEHKNMFELTTT